MRVLLVSTVSPYPKSVGKTVVLGGIVDYLLSRADCEIGILCFEPAQVPGPTTLCAVLPRPGVKDLLWAFLSRGLAGRSSIQELFFRSGRALKDVQRAIDRMRPQVVIWDTVRVQQYAASLQLHGARSVTYLDDLFSVRYERILDASAGGQVDASVLGRFFDRLPGPLRAIFLGSNACRRAVLGFEARAVRRSEMRALQQSDACCLVSGVEVEVAQRRCPSAEVFELPPRLVYPSEGRRARAWNGRPVFTFVGSLRLQHNAAGMRWFIQKCFPLLLSRVPDVCIHIVGAGAVEELDAAATAFPDHVKVLGFVDDLDLELAGCCALISPLVSGSGIKIKIIDALRCGVPIVSTSVGAEGIPSGPQHGILVADSVEGFVASLASLLDPTMNMRVAQGAGSLFATKYAPDRVNLLYDRLLS